MSRRDPGREPLPTIRCSPSEQLLRAARDTRTVRPTTPMPPEPTAEAIQETGATDPREQVGVRGIDASRTVDPRREEDDAK